MKRVLAVAFLCSLALPAAKRPILPTDLYRIQQVTAVDIAADGSKAVFAVRSIADEAYRTNLWLIDLNKPGAAPIALTPGDRRDASPKLSPDARWLAFARRDPGKDGRLQIWLMPVSVPGEARMLTHLEFGVAEFAWRPDGSGILATSNIPVSKIDGVPPFPMERPGRAWKDVPHNAKADPDGPLSQVRAWLEANSADSDPTLITRLNFQDEESLRRELAIANLYSFNLSGSSKRLTHSFEPHLNIRISPDGQSILYTTLPADNLHPDRYGSLTFNRNILVEKKLDGSARRVLLAGSEQVFSPQYSLDGNYILAGTRTSDDRYAAQIRLTRLGRDGKRTDSAWPGSVNSFEPTAGGALLSGAWHGGAPLIEENFGGAPKPLMDGPTGVGVFAAANGRVVYSLISVPNPNELYLREPGGQTRRLTNLNTGWLAEREISIPEEHWLTRPDGTKVQFWIMKPTGPTQNGKIPWVLDMHGGPAAMWGPGEFTMWHEFQLMCSWGFGLVYANPRGSGGYGRDFQRANFQDWGVGPAGDVLAALDETAKLIPALDRDRLFLTGGSYAGYLTAWIVAHDHRFKAAASQRGVYDLRTFFGEGNAWHLSIDAFGGVPWDARFKSEYEEESPFSHVANIRTPLLILHASNDLRTGVSQSEMLYRALKYLDRPVEYVRYPGSGHELTRGGPPRQRLDHMLRILEFFTRYSTK